MHNSNIRSGVADMAVYVKTVQLGPELPIGPYNEILKILNNEKLWNSPHQLVQDYLSGRVDRRKREL